VEEEKTTANTQPQVVRVPPVNARAKMQAAGLAAANNYEGDAVERIRRMSILAADCEVRGTRKANLASFVGQQEWFDTAPLETV
jgi:COP9 signalosome complex subunit 1